MPKLATLVATILLLTGCASLVSSATTRMADNITLAISNQDDPATVRDGAPAYLLMIDGLIEGDPENIDLLLSGAKLYGSYASAFVEDETRAQRLANKSYAYAKRALCEQVADVCNSTGARLDQFQASLTASGTKDLKVLYGFAVAWAGWIQANSSDWNAIADISKVKVLFQHCLELDETFDDGGSHIYLGVFESLLPPSLGGQPEIARKHFERALELSQGRNLMISVLMAKHYARLVFDQELHDSLLGEVLSTDPVYPGFTLINTLAKPQAEQLLAESEAFF